MASGRVDFSSSETRYTKHTYFFIWPNMVICWSVVIPEIILWKKKNNFESDKKQVKLASEQRAKSGLVPQKLISNVAANYSIIPVITVTVLQMRYLTNAVPELFVPNPFLH